MQFGVGHPARYVNNDLASAKKPLARFMAVRINSYVKLLVYAGGERGLFVSDVADREVRVGERWYVSCFQRGWMI
jgi:hypothetical protein